MSSEDDDIPQLQAQSGGPQTSTDELAAGVSRWMRASEPFLYVELASLVLMLACVADWAGTIWFKYALSVACVSLILCLIMQTCEFFVPGFLDLEIVQRRVDGTGGHTVQKICSIFLLIWWLFGTCFITFKAPFSTTSNGWFGAWAGLLSSMKWAVGINSMYAGQSENVKWLINLATCSFVLLLASIPPLTQKWQHYPAAGFSIAGAAISIVCVTYMIVVQSSISRSIMKTTLVMLFILCIIVAGVVTFHGPFLVTNNGYFSAWGSALCALKLLLMEMSDESPEYA